jgi:hypothetical protein
MTNLESIQATEPRWVVHPLDDIPEEKRNVASLGPMPITKTVRGSLLVLRVYLILMAFLVGYRFLSVL